jgi:hypothetical protein
MNRSYSKIRHIQESNQILESRVINEQVVSNVTQLVEDIVGFILNMKIIPGPIDAGKFLYELYNSKNPVQTIKKFVRSRVPSPKENWKKIENDLDKLGGDLDDFKKKLYSELKNRFQ